MVDVELGIETFSCKRNLEAAGFFAVFKEGLAVLVYISERRAVHIILCRRRLQWLNWVYSAPLAFVAMVLQG